MAIWDEYNSSDRAYLVLGWLDSQADGVKRLALVTHASFDVWGELSMPDRHVVLMSVFDNFPHPDKPLAYAAVNAFKRFEVPCDQYEGYLSIGKDYVAQAAVEPDEHSGFIGYLDDKSKPDPDPVETKSGSVQPFENWLNELLGDIGCKFGEQEKMKQQKDLHSFALEAMKLISRDSDAPICGASGAKFGAFVREYYLALDPQAGFVPVKTEAV